MFVPFVPDLSSICQETRSDCPCSSLDKAVQTGCAGLNSFFPSGQELFLTSRCMQPDRDHLGSAEGVVNVLDRMPSWDVRMVEMQVRHEERGKGRGWLPNPCALK
eukprot:1094050-Pelagomonas_calceolata.AAC.3